MDKNCLKLLAMSATCFLFGIVLVVLGVFFFRVFPKSETNTIEYYILFIFPVFFSLVFSVPGILFIVVSYTLLKRTREYLRGNKPKET